MRHPQNRIPFAIVRITTPRLPIKEKLMDLLLDYQENVYYLGSEQEFIDFTNGYKIHFRLLKDIENYVEYIESCEIFYFDENELDTIGELKNKSNWVML